MPEFTKSLNKSEVARLLDVTSVTLSNYLNHMYLKELQQIGYRKNSKKLNPKILNYLNEKIGLTNDNDRE